MFEQIYSKLKCEQCGAHDKLYIDSSKNIECEACAWKFAKGVISEKDYDLERELAKQAEWEAR